ncbi:MAG TPA: LLM class flavin-dependent oxidoreductase [Chloroflexota bacterium]|jgi:alkanesulfonate monooxygenase SsuD/methylene tetrahydromethanopterin reductase-like flavin-dependent oxidoreductase (luciferase family)
MRVFIFDLLPYGENLEHLKNGASELPWPLAKQHFKPEVAVRTYQEHLEAWEALDKLGYDGVGFNEHHTSPYGLMNSPNLLAASAAQRTKNLKLLIYGNLLPIHDPLRLAEELAMLDCLSNGRIISGFARGIPREHNVYNVPLSESRARFEEAWEIIRRAWTEEVFSYDGRFWQYKDVAIWPRPVQQPHPPVWVPVTASKETIEWAGEHNIPITPGIASHRGVREDVIRYYTRQLNQHGHQITPGHLVIQADVYVADTKEQAIEQAGPYALYFNRTLFSHGNITERKLQAESGYVTNASHDYLRPENVPLVSGSRERYRSMTMDGIRQVAQEQPWGPPDEVAERIISAADHAGANQVTVSLNRGAMPHAMFMQQIERFAREVLPRLQAHQVTRVPAAEAAPV